MCGEAGGKDVASRIVRCDFSTQMVGCHISGRLFSTNKQTLRFTFLFCTEHGTTDGTLPVRLPVGSCQGRYPLRRLPGERCLHKEASYGTRMQLRSRPLRRLVSGIVAVRKATRRSLGGQ